MMSDAPNPSGRTADVRSTELVLAMVLAPLLLLWTLPQTLAGLCLALFRRLQGHRPHLCLFGPFLFLVVPASGPFSTGISLGLVVFACTPGLLKHEFCHLLTGLWLSWLYLPVYGLEYLVVGHDRSPHERLTCSFERTVSWSGHPVRRRRDDASASGSNGIG